MIEIRQMPELPKTPLPIIIIGAGGIVADAHLPAYKMAGFPILGIYDIHVEKAEELKNKFPFIRQVFYTFEEVQEALRKNNVVVDLAIPPSQTMEILDRLPAKTAVLIQKPLGENLDQARSILELCRSQEFISGVNFQFRYAPYNIAAQSLIDQGALGQVYDYEIKVCVHTPWHLWEFLYDSARVEILYHSIHYIDLIRHFAGNPSRIYASTVRHPMMEALTSTRSTIIMDYDGMLQGRIITNHGHTFGPDHEESYLKIEGTEGAVKIRIGVSLDYPKGMPPRFEYVINSDGKGWRDLPLTGGWFPHAFIGTMAGIQRYYLGETQTFDHDIENAFETMKWVEKAYISSESGGVR